MLPRAGLRRGHRRGHRPGDVIPDAGGRDDVAGSVAAAVAAAQARAGEHKSDTYGQSSVIGDLMTLPSQTTTGSTDGAYYDPPRNY